MIRTTITLTCDYKHCNNSGQNTPMVLQWCQSDIDKGIAKPPEALANCVVFSLKGTEYSFCSQLHAAKFFLPPGYEIKQAQAVDIRSRETVSPVNGQEGV